MSRSGWRVVGAVVAASAVVTVAGCSSEPDPDPAVQALVSALGSGDFTDVPLADVAADAAGTRYDEVVEGLGDIRPQVSVGTLGEPSTGDDEGVRTVELELAWPFEDETWTYPTTAELVPDEESEGYEVRWAPTLIHPDLTEGATLSRVLVEPERADIVTTGGDPVVTRRTVFRVGVDKTRVEGADAQAESAAAVAELVGVDADALADRVAAAGEQAFVEAIQLRDEDYQPVAAGLADVPGALAQETTLPLAPTRTFARPVLGGVGEASAEQIEAADGALEIGDLVGTSGLQERFDTRLRGTAGSRILLTPADDEAADEVVLAETDPVPGEPLAVTLDVEAQQRAEAVLADVGPASALVAIRPSTGEVLVVASGPGGEGLSTATTGQYAPGSTFKVVTSLALLRAGMTPDDAVECAETVTVDGRAFGNYSDYPAAELGTITLRDALAFSCNTAFIGELDTVGQADLAEAAASLGLGPDVDLGVPAFLGSVPNEAEGTAHAASMIGQGQVLASPLAMATVAASVAAGGTVTPRLLGPDEPTDPASAEATDAASPEPSGSAEPAPPAVPLTAAEAEALQAMMAAVVSEGSGDVLADLPGDPVGAKTGTAEYGTDTPPRTHAWMIATQGDLAVSVFVEDGESGSRTAGPLLAEFLAGG